MPGNPSHDHQLLSNHISLYNEELYFMTCPHQFWRHCGRWQSSSCLLDWITNTPPPTRIRCQWGWIAAPVLAVNNQSFCEGWIALESRLFSDVPRILAIEIMVKQWICQHVVRRLGPIVLTDQWRCACRLMEGSGTGHWPTNTSIVSVRGIQGNGGLTLLSLSSWRTGLVALDTALSTMQMNSTRGGTHNQHPLVIHRCDWRLLEWSRSTMTYHLLYHPPSFSSRIRCWR